MNDYRLRRVLIDLEAECDAIAGAFGQHHILWTRRARAVRAAQDGKLTKAQVRVLEDYRKQETRLMMMMREAAGSEREILRANRDAAEALEEAIRRAS